MLIIQNGCNGAFKTNLPDSITIGWEADQYAYSVDLDISQELARWPGSVPVLIYYRPGEKNIVQPAVTTLNGTTLSWSPDAYATAIHGGSGEAQIVFTTAGDPVIVGHSKRMKLAIFASLEASEDPPEPYETWIQSLLDAAAEAVDAAEAAIAAAEMIKTITASATTLPAGSLATASYDDGHLSLGIPKGDKGDTGETGATPNLTIGTVSTLPPGSDATAEITGTPEDPVLSLGIPEGDQGERGPIGPTPNLTIGTVTTLPTGSDATAEITGTPENPVLNLGLPRGEPGEVTEAQLQAVIDNKADVIVDSTNGSIATFPDGADNAPIKLLTVNIDPVQDLHGYDRPWAGGGSANLFGGLAFANAVVTAMPSAVLDTTNKTVSFDGNTNGYYQKIISGNLTFKENTQYTFINQDTTGNIKNIRWKYTDDTTDTQYDPSVGAYVSAEGKTVAALIKIGNNSVTVVLSYEKCGIFEGVVTTDQFVPYENICPISGYTSATIDHIAYNGFDDPVAGYNINASGEVVPFGTYTLTSKVPSKKSDTVILQYTYNGGHYRRIGAYDRYNRFLGFITNESPTGNNTYNLSYTNEFDDCAYILTALPNTASSTAVFKSHIDEEIEIEFPTEAGTVYGGTLRINEDGTGTLTVDKKGITLDGTEDWTMNSVGKFYASVIPINEASSVTTGNEYISNIYPFDGTGNTNSAGVTSDKHFYGQRTFGRFWVYDSQYTTLEAFTTALETTNLQIVYPLTDPVVYTLTAQQIKTFFGYNKFQADIGDVYLTYRADTKLYIDKKIAAALAGS